MGGSGLRSHEHQWVRQEEALREAGVGQLPPATSREDARERARLMVAIRYSKSREPNSRVFIKCQLCTAKGLRDGVDHGVQELMVGTPQAGG